MVSMPVSVSSSTNTGMADGELSVCADWQVHLRWSLSATTSKSMVQGSSLLPEELNSPVFKAELQEVVDTLRESVLKNRFAMERFCYEHGGKISYCTAYDLDVQRQNMAQEEAPHMDMEGVV